MPRADLPPLDWDGFIEPNYTPVPDSLFDVLLPYLSDAELRVLLYLVRRTYGFKKRSDSVSLSQITGGIVRADGTRLDGGAGISRGGAQRALAGLVEKGIITAEHNTSARYGNQATTYTVRVSRGPTREYRGVYDGAAAIPPPALPLASVDGPQETPVQETVKQESGDEDAVTPAQTRLRALQDRNPPAADFQAGRRPAGPLVPGERRTQKERS